MDMLKSYAKEFKKTEAFGYVNSLSTKVKQMALNLTDLEVKVEEATNNEPWGPHGSAMAEISEAAYDSEGYRQIMGVIARRLQDTGELWRHVYKSLLLLEYMLKHGPQKVVQELSSNLIVIEKLQNFQYKDKNLRDHGENVRHRAKQLCELVVDPERVRAERKKAKELKSKYTGVSSDMARKRLGGGGGGGSSGGRKYYDDEDDDDVYATRESRNGSSTKGDRGAIGQSSRSDSDPLEATRARIEAIKARGPADSEADADGESAVRQGRKLSTMRVDPKVSASLGLKAPAQAAAPPKARPAAAGKAGQAQEIDLMGGFDDEPAAADSAARSSTDTWNAFEGAQGGAASAPQASAAQGNSWADFGEAGSHSTPAAAAKSADPVADLFALDSAPAAQPAKPEPTASPGDPFGDFDSARAATALPATSAAGAAPKPTTLSKAALPEDVFSELPPPTVDRPLQPPVYGSGAQGAPYGAGSQGSPYGAPQPAGGQFPQQQGFAQFTSQPDVLLSQTPATFPGAQPQPGMPGYGAVPPLAAGTQTGGSGSLPAGFGAPPQPQAHIDDLVPPGKSIGKQQLPASNGNDPFAGLGF